MTLSLAIYITPGMQIPDVNRSLTMEYCHHYFNESVKQTVLHFQTNSFGNIAFVLEVGVLYIASFLMVFIAKELVQDEKSY